jgi:steroid delta-isomerase-like uncharacterized protein
MSAEDNKTVARRWFEELWGGNRPELMDELASPDFVMHYGAVSASFDLPVYRQAAVGFRTAFPDIEITIEDMLAEGDRVAVRTTQRATHRGEYRGIPATGRRVTQTSMAIFRIDGNRIAEMWVEEVAWADRIQALSAL